MSKKEILGKNNKPKYHYLILPDSTLNYEAIEEVIREQESYNKKFKNTFNRAGYIFDTLEKGTFPVEMITDIKESGFYKFAKEKSFNKTYLSTNSKNFDNFNVIVSSNKDFIKWVTLKLVEIENNDIPLKFKKINYNGFLGSFNIED